MPFESEAQRRFMFAQHPRIAKRWAKHTPKGKDLPEKKTDSDPEETKAKAESEKKAAVRMLGLHLSKIDSLIKLASTLDESDISAIVGGGVGASLPLISAGQDLKRGLNFRDAISNLDESKFISHSKLQKLQRLGDFGLTMKDYAAREMSPAIKFLAGGSAMASGTGFGHGVFIGPNGRVFHGGSAFSPSDLKIPKAFQGSKIYSLIDLANALETMDTTEGFKPSKLLEEAKIHNRARHFIKTPEGQQQMAKLFKSHLRKGSKQMVDDVRDFAAVFRPNKAYTSAEKDLLSDYLKKTFHGSYDAPKATWAGLKEVLFPKIDITRTAKTLNQVCDLTGHCGSVPAGAAELLGIARRGSRNVLPANIVNNPNLNLEYIAGQGTPKAIKENVLKLLNKSVRGRALIGLGAAAGLGGAGALVGKILPPSEILSGIDSGLSGLRNLINIPLKTVARQM